MKTYYCIQITFEGSKLCLKYNDHITFTDTCGYKWTSKEKAETRLNEIQNLELPENFTPEILSSLCVVEFTEAEYNKTKVDFPKVTKRLKGPLGTEQKKFIDRAEKRETEVPHNFQPAPTDIYTKEDYENEEYFDPRENWTKYGFNKQCAECVCKCKQHGASIIFFCQQFRKAS